MQVGDGVVFTGFGGEPTAGRIIGEEGGCGCGYWIITTGSWWWARAKCDVRPAG